MKIFVKHRKRTLAFLVFKDQLRTGKACLFAFFYSNEQKTLQLRQKKERCRGCDISIDREKVIQYDLSFANRHPVRYKSLARSSFNETSSLKEIRE